MWWSSAYKNIFVKKLEIFGGRKGQYWKGQYWKGNIAVQYKQQQLSFLIFIRFVTLKWCKMPL